MSDRALLFLRSSFERAALASLLLTLAWTAAPGPAGAADFQLFETGPVRTMARSGDTLYVVNTPDNRLHIFDITDAGLVETGQVQVGMEPCAVAVVGNGTVWVVNHLSDSVSIVDPTQTPPEVVRTLNLADEPRDIVTAGSPERVFISAAHRGQQRTDPSIAGVTGAGDPQLTTPGVGRTDVWVFDPANLGATFGGTPIEILSFFGDTPRALATGGGANNRVFVAPFKSGNQTTVIPEAVVCNGFQLGQSCSLGPFTIPGGAVGPSDNADGANAPEVGLIVKFNNQSGNWEDDIGTDWSGIVNFDLPDTDVFQFNANTLQLTRSWAHVGTTIFNMRWLQTRNKLYVSNIEAPNHIDFEGPGDHGSTTVQGHVSESRITMLEPDQPSAPIHLNKHIDYSKLHTDTPDLVDTTAKDHSLATPLEMVFSGDESTVYVAAFGSAKIGVFDTVALEDDTFDPTVDSANFIPTAGGPSGLVLDEPRGWIIVTTRFDNAVSVIDLATKATLQSVPLHNPEPQRRRRRAPPALRRLPVLGQRRGLMLELSHLRRHGRPGVEPRRPRRLGHPEPAALPGRHRRRDAPPDEGADDDTDAARHGHPWRPPLARRPRRRLLRHRCVQRAHRRRVQRGALVQQLHRRLRRPHRHGGHADHDRDGRSSRTSRCS